MSGLLFAFLSALFFALNGVCVRRGVLQVSSAFLGVAVTLYVALPLFMLVLVALGKLSEVWAFPWHSYLFLSASGIVHFLLGRTLNYSSVKLIGANMSNVLQRTSPIIAVGLGVLIFGELLTWWVGLGAVTITAGVMLIAWGPVATAHGTGGAPGMLSNGVLMALAAGLVYGVSPILVKLALRDGGDPVAGTFIAYISAASVLSIFVTGKKRRYDLTHLGRRALLWFCISAVAVSSAQTFRYAALGLAPVSQVTPLIATSPLLLIALSAIVNRKLEVFSKRLLAGALATVLGTVILLQSP